MNTIEAIEGFSRFVPEPHLVFEVDGEPLEQILFGNDLNDASLGLVPTTLNWLIDEREQAVVWQRFSVCETGSVRIPILCCPDDLDFSCALFIVVATFCKTTVQWQHFGYDSTPFDRLPEEVGACVEWLPGVGPFTFERKQYEDMVQRFEKACQHS